MAYKVQEYQNQVAELNGNIEITRSRVAEIKKRLQQPVFEDLISDYFTTVNINDEATAVPDTDDVIGDVYNLVERIEESILKTNQDERISVMQTRVKESEDRILLHLTQVGAGQSLT